MDGWMDAGNDRRAGLGSSPRRHARHGQTRRRPGDLAPHGNLAVSRRRLPVRMGGPVLQSGRLGLVVLWRVQGALGLLRALDTSHLLESPEARVHGLPPRGELARLSVEQGDTGGGARVLSVGTGRRERRRLIAGRPQLVLRSASDPRVERVPSAFRPMGRSCPSRSTTRANGQPAEIVRARLAHGRPSDNRPSGPGTRAAAECRGTLLS